MAFGNFVVILVISCRLAYGTIPLASISGIKKDALGNVLNLASSVLHTDNSGIKQGVVGDILNVAESTLHEDISVMEKDAVENVLNIAKDITEVSYFNYYT